MSTALPLGDVDVLRRIRTLRVERAMRLVADARAAVDAAGAVVAQRLERVEAIRGSLDGLREAIGSALAPELPRWASLIFTRQQGLTDQLERAEDKLLTARERLDGAQKALQRARAELASAQRREQVADDLARRARRKLAIERERRLEREAEPLSRAEWRAR
jgi:multidrug resistance efflux pump